MNSWMLFTSDEFMADVIFDEFMEVNDFIGVAILDAVLDAAISDDERFNWPFSLTMTKRTCALCEGLLYHTTAGQFHEIFPINFKWKCIDDNR